MPAGLRVVQPPMVPSLGSEWNPGSTPATDSPGYHIVVINELFVFRYRFVRDGSVSSRENLPTAYRPVGRGMGVVNWLVAAGKMRANAGAGSCPPNAPAKLRFPG